MSVRLVTPPAVEPVDLEVLKKHLRVENDDENALILGWARAARVWGEGYTNRAWMTQTRELVLPAFNGARAIALPYPPLVEVVSVKFTDSAGAPQTWDPTGYVVDRVGDLENPGRIFPAYQGQYPTDVRAFSGSVVIRFVCGYGSTPETLAAPLSASAPAGALAAVKIFVAELYKNREESNVGNVSHRVPLGVRTLLDTIRFFGGNYGD